MVIGGASTSDSPTSPRAKVGVDEFRHRLVICFLGKSLRSHRTSVKLANEAMLGGPLLLLIISVNITTRRRAVSPNMRVLHRLL